MDATSLLNIILRLAIWFLLTADLGLANIIIGVSIALLLPRNKTSLGALNDWLRVLWEIIVAIPDIGLMWDHPDLINNVWQNSGAYSE